MSIGILFFLILVNGLFAMIEIAVVSARKARLQNMADDGRAGAAMAMALHDDPSRFLSTVQVGITSIGILSGAIGEVTLADPLAQTLSEVPGLADYADGIALTVTVLAITYLSVVIGELVPKRLALLAPENIAAFAARPMHWLARIARPLVWLFSSSSNALLRLIGARGTDDPPISDEEIEVLMEQGAEAGVFHSSEQAIVSNVLRLDQQRVGAIMTPRNQVYHIDLNDPPSEIRRKIADSPYAQAVVCRDGIEHVFGVLVCRDLLKPLLEGHAFDPMSAVRPALYVPETITSQHLFESFRRARTDFAIVVDEFGDMQGVVTLTDVFGAIVGDLPSDESPADAEIVRREDGSWLVDGGTAIQRLKTTLEIDDTLPGEDTNSYHTVGGLVMHVLERMPAVADHFVLDEWRFEVVDMDKTRVDKVLVARVHAKEPESETAPTTPN